MIPFIRCSRTLSSFPWVTHIESLMALSYLFLLERESSPLTAPFRQFDSCHGYEVCLCFVSPSPTTHTPLGSRPLAEQLGELLHGDPHGDRATGLHHELHHRQEQEQPAGPDLVQLSPGASGEQLLPSGSVPCSSLCWACLCRCKP